MSAATTMREPSRQRRATVVTLALALAALLCLPALSIPFDADEHLVLSGVGGDGPWMGTTFDLYRFSSGEPGEVRARVAAGTMPWFTSPEFRYALWRPLSSALLAADWHLFGAERLGYQLHSVLWWLLLVGVAAALLLRLLRWHLAVTALLAFVCCSFHAEPIGWLTARLSHGRGLAA